MEEQHQIECDTLPAIPDFDPSSWPSTYYKRTRHIDLVKLYNDVLDAVEQAKMADVFDPSHQSVNHTTAYTGMGPNTKCHFTFGRGMTGFSFKYHGYLRLQEDDCDSQRTIASEQTKVPQRRPPQKKRYTHSAGVKGPVRTHSVSLSSPSASDIIGSKSSQWIIMFTKLRRAHPHKSTTLCIS